MQNFLNKKSLKIKSNRNNWHRNCILYFYMTLENYLALLSWQGCKIFLSDFKSLRLCSSSNPEILIKHVSHTDTKSFLIQNPNWWKTVETQYRLCRKKGYQITWPGQADYPEPFLQFEGAPPILTYIGCLHNSGWPVTLVGSRKSSDLALNWMDFFLPQVIQEQNLCVVSGGARGIDQKAHLIAIRLKRPTLCFLPSGLDHFYPSGLNQLKKTILDCGGGFVSSFPPDFQMRKQCFYIRNRLMACFSILVLVLQAEMRSGTMLTARKALDFGVPVGAISGPPLSPLFAGNLQLIYDGAFLLRDGLDLALLVESFKKDKESFQPDLIF